MAMQNSDNPGDFRDKALDTKNSPEAQSGIEAGSELNQVQKKVSLNKGRQKEMAKEIAKEIGGPKGPEPTRYGDWERKGRCIDF